MLLTLVCQNRVSYQSERLSGLTLAHTRTPGVVCAWCLNPDTVPEPVVPILEIPRVNPYLCYALDMLDGGDRMLVFCCHVGVGALIIGCNILYSDLSYLWQLLFTNICHKPLFLTELLSFGKSLKFLYWDKAPHPLQLQIGRSLSRVTNKSVEVCHRCLLWTANLLLVV